MKEAKTLSPKTRPSFPHTQHTAALPAAAAGPEIARVQPSVSASLAARDAAADFKCKGGMMDCDGDRREFAKNQWRSFLARGGAKKGADAK